MAILFELRERRVIPNWRDYKRTVQLGELNQSNKIEDPVLTSITRSIHDWSELKTIATAADLINSSFVSSLYTSEVQEAIDFVRASKNQRSTTLMDIADLIENGFSTEKNIINNSLLEIDVDTINEFQAYINNRAFHKIISRTKARARNELKNPIVWVELGRLYSMRGQELKASNAIKTALHLAPDNRFVLRSATRFFIHSGNPEIALHYLRTSKKIKRDPWLISAHIATSSILGRFSPFIKPGKLLLESGKYSDFEITELASSIGTLEFNSGSFKNAKKYFNRSMARPNDNSLAQLEWISKDDIRFNINIADFSKVINPFEAKALEDYTAENWNGALENAIKWFLDMPFSKRPILLASHIAGTLLDDKEAAILLCQVGLQANPQDPSLLNNMVYYSASADNFHELDSYIHKMMSVNFKELTEDKKITYFATLGLVALKKGDVELGKNLYKRAIDNSIRIKNEYLTNLAIANFTIQLVNMNLPEKADYVEKVRNMKIQKNQKDLHLLRNEIFFKLEHIPGLVASPWSQKNNLNS